MTKLLPIKNIKLDPKLIAFPYQKDAVESIKDLAYGAIFHEQGLGKTKIAIDIILYWLTQQLVDSVLIITKKSLINNWKNELLSHTHVAPAILTLSRKHNYNIFTRQSRIILANFEILISEKERFKLFLKSRDVSVIIDESTKIKSPDSKITQCLFDLSSLFIKRIIMTGTPVANRPYDIWAQIYFLDGGKSLGDNFKSFKKKTDLPKGIDGNSANNIKFENELNSIWNKIKHFTIRKTKNSGIITLPKKEIETHVADWEDRQYEIYNMYREDLSAYVTKNGMPINDDADYILKRLLRLSQITSNPKLVDESYNNEPGKFSTLKSIVIKICRDNQKCIVWSNYNDNVDWLARNLKQFGSCRIHGKLLIDERNRSIDKFKNDPDTKVLVATPGAAKEGLTLTVANHAIFYDRSFSLDDYLQAQDRIHRISQTQTCYIYNIMLPESIDQWIDILIAAKYNAAKLTQGDITKENFQIQMDYSFNDVLRNILNIAD